MYKYATYTEGDLYVRIYITYIIIRGWLMYKYYHQAYI